MEDSTVNPVIKSKCETCLFYLKDKKCAAFSGDIPDDIWNCVKEHNKVVKEQQTDIVYVEHGNLI